MPTYEKPDIDGLARLRLAYADLMLKFTADPKRPIALVTPSGEVPLFMEAVDELHRMLGAFARRALKAGQASGVCVFADHADGCQCGSKVPE